MKRGNTQSKKTTERYNHRISTANAEVNNLADHYHQHWSTLHLLGMEESDPHFRHLKDADAVNVKLSMAQNLLGQSKEAILWIWGNFSFVKHETDSQYQEFYNDSKCNLVEFLLCMLMTTSSSSCPLVPFKCRVCTIERRSPTPQGRNAPHAALTCLHA